MKMFAMFAAAVTLFAGSAPALAQGRTVMCHGGGVYITYPCVQQPQPVRVNVGQIPDGRAVMPYQQQRPFPQKNVGVRQMVILPPQQSRGVMGRDNVRAGDGQPMMGHSTGPIVVRTTGPQEVGNTAPTVLPSGVAIEKGRSTDRDCFILPNGNLGCPNHFVNTR